MTLHVKTYKLNQLKLKIMKKLGWLQISAATPLQKENLQKRLRGVAVCLSTEYDFKAFGEIDECLDPDYDLDNYKDNPYFEMLRKQYMLIRFIEEEYFRKYGNSYCSFEEVQDYLDSIDDLRTLNESCLEEIDKIIGKKIKGLLSNIRTN